MRTPRNLIDPPPALTGTHLSIQIRIPVLLRVGDVVGAELGINLSLVLAAGEAIVPAVVVQEAGPHGAAGALADDDGLVEAVVVDLALRTGVRGAPSEVGV
jgi:hypothetical protein